MKIPFHKPAVGEEEAEAVRSCIMNGWLTMGEETFAFEREFSRMVDADHAVAVNSCTAALHLALRCIGIGPGDEVILPVNSFVSSDEVLRYFGARPVLADIDRTTHSIDAAVLEGLVTEKTRAVIPVHFSGQAADIDEIKEVIEGRNIAFVDDAAHAFPASYKNKKIGSLGDITCFSFYATKTIAVGEGGMATTNNEEWAAKMKKLRLHGIDSDSWKRYRSDGRWAYDVTETGYKYNTTDMNSAMGRVQLKKSPDLTEKRTVIAGAYNQAFSTCDALIPYRGKDDRISSWHLYPLKLNLEALSIDRDRFIVLLGERGISCSVHFIPLYRFSIYGDSGYRIEDFPESEWVFERTLSLPIYPDLSGEEVEYIISSVLDIAEKYRR